MNRLQGLTLSFSYVSSYSQYLSVYSYISSLGTNSSLKSAKVKNF